MGRIIRSNKCANCRKRKIKCDECPPACSQCLRAGWVCPGYHNEIGVVFRDQTALVVARQEKKRAAALLGLASTRDSRKEILSDETSRTALCGDTRSSITKAMVTNQESRKITYNGSTLRSLSSDGVGRSYWTAENQGTASTTTAFHHTPLPALSTNLEDRATAFFFGHYVSEGRHGNHEYLPAIYAEEQQERSDGPVKSMIIASGLASLANKANDEQLLLIARKLYGKAIGLINNALADPLRVKSDQTLAAVLLLSIFEAITASNEAAMLAWSYHILGAINLIEIRGPEQFGSERALRMFVQIRRLIVLACHQLRLPFPFVVQKWMSWAEQAQLPDEIPANKLMVLNESLTMARAWIKENNITDPIIIATKLIPIDRAHQEWADNLPDTWRPTTYNVSSRYPSPENSSSTRTETKGKEKRQDDTDSLENSSSLFDEKYNTSYNGQFDIYEDLWIASVWNNYRGSRILIHETIVSSAISNPPAPGTPNYLIDSIINESASALIDLTASVCRSVYFHMNSRSRSGSLQQSSTSMPPRRSTMPPDATYMCGTYLIIWPLYMAGLLRTTPCKQRAWLADKLEIIGRELGNKQAIMLSNALREFKNETFINTKEWYGGSYLDVAYPTEPMDGEKEV